MWGKKGFLYILYRILFRKYKSKNHIELSRECEIGKGLYIGHPYGITINPAAKIGCNCNIHKGVKLYEWITVREGGSIHP